MPQGIYHIATAIYHISGGNISRSQQGTYHWALRKSLFAMPFLSASTLDTCPGNGVYFVIETLFTVLREHHNLTHRRIPSGLPGRSALPATVLL